MRTRKEELIEHGVKLVLECMSNASTEKISPIDWWPRAKSALLAATARATTWGELVDTMCRKLEVNILRNDSAKAIYLLALDGDQLREFKRLMQREGIYVVAEAQVERERQRQAAKEAQA